MEKSQSENKEDFYYLLKKMNSSIMNPYYFKKICFLNKQEKVVEILDENKIKSVEVIVYVYNAYIFMKNEYIKLRLEKKEDFLFINDKYVKNAIKDYLILLMFQDINSKLAVKYSERVLEGNDEMALTEERMAEISDNDYYRDFTKAKKELPYYKKFLKLYNSDDTVTLVIELINKNIDKEDFFTLSSAVDFLYETIKNEKSE